MSLLFIYAHIKLLFALVSSGDLFFPGSIDGLSKKKLFYTLLLPARQNACIWIKLMLFLYIGLYNVLLQNLKVKDSQQAALPE